jgi:hypothetical protein
VLLAAIAALVAVALIGAVVVLGIGRRRQARADLHGVVDTFAFETTLREYLKSAQKDVGLPSAEEGASLELLERYFKEKRLAFPFIVDPATRSELERGRHSLPFYLRVSANDAWGHPFVFRRPGRLHPKGWEIVSFGPNGEDDGGQGDDIVVGADDEPAGALPRSGE